MGKQNRALGDVEEPGGRVAEGAVAVGAVALQRGVTELGPAAQGSILARLGQVREVVGPCGFLEQAERGLVRADLSQSQPLRLGGRCRPASSP